MRWTFLAVLLGTACGDNSSTLADAIDSPTNDTGPPHPIVGLWQREGVGPMVTVTFEANGRYTYNTEVGTWSIQDGQLTTRRPSYTETAPFYLSDDLSTLMTVAARPITATSGLVGTWKGEYTYGNGDHNDDTFEFRSDNTLVWVQIRNTASPVTIQAMWELQGESSIHFWNANGINVGMRLIPDVVIGDGLYRRSQ